MKCDNVEKNCAWEGTVGTLEKHVATCDYTLLPCPKQCRDDSNEVKKVMRKDLAMHLKNVCSNRDYSCKHCEEKGTYAFITQLHINTCPKRPLPCPNGCNITIEHRYLGKHVAADCELSQVPCKYKKLECDSLLKRKDMPAHEEDDKFHLRMAMDTTVKLENKTIALESKAVESERVTKERITELENEIAELKVLKNREPLKFKMTDFQRTKDEDECVQSPSYYTPQGYHVALQVYPNGQESGQGTHVSVFASILEGKYDAQLKWPVTGQLTFTLLLNQLGDKNHHQEILYLTREPNVQPGKAWGLDLIRHSELDYKPLKNTQYRRRWYLSACLLISAAYC